MNEAFPKTAEYACSMQRSTRYSLNTLPRIFGAILAVLLATYMVACTFPTKS